MRCRNRPGESGPVTLRLAVGRRPCHGRHPSPVTPRDGGPATPGIPAQPHRGTAALPPRPSQPHCGTAALPPRPSQPSHTAAHWLSHTTGWQPCYPGHPSPATPRDGGPTTRISQPSQCAQGHSRTTHGPHLTFPSGVLFSTQISSAGGIAGVPGAETGGIPGGNIIPGGGGMLPMGGGINGGL